MIPALAERLGEWQQRAGRHHLPWQGQGPYATWISEIMLQQTQVAVVIPYYQRFMERFPTIAALATAPLDAVLAHWAGLGYYARARNLHAAAQYVLAQHEGQLPSSIDALMALQGIGRSTAGAIRSLGFRKRGVIQDGNVRRVLARLHAITGNLTTAESQRRLWALAEHYTPTSGEAAALHTQAMMDLGALLCTRHRPQCVECPIQADCHAYQHGLTDEIPSAKAIRKRQTEAWVVLKITNDDGNVWLERRPERGIWGGLFCPPTGSSITRLLSELDLPEDIGWIDGPECTHAFSHFSVVLTRLDIEIGRWESPREGQWVSLASCEAGLPAPIVKLLDLS